MAAQTLVQALEGASFPCDRAQLIEYARRNNVAHRTLAALEEIPERQYRDLGEVFTALPGRPQAGKPPPDAGPSDAGSSEEEEGMPPLPAALDWWLAGWRQAALPWEMAAHCLRGSLEVWPQWARLTQHLWFPWSK
ncbi:MAG: DUF2795 domain-containing protein [Bacteroidota bacterium]